MDYRFPDMAGPRSKTVIPEVAHGTSDSPATRQVNPLGAVLEMSVVDGEKVLTAAYVHPSMTTRACSVVAAVLASSVSTVELESSTTGAGLSPGRYS